MPRIARRKRGRGPRMDALRNWAKSAHKKIRSVHGYSRAGKYLHGKTHKIISKALPGSVGSLVNKGIAQGLAHLHRKGYGVSRSGGALRRVGRRRGYGVRRH